VPLSKALPLASDTITKEPRHQLHVGGGWQTNSGPNEVVLGVSTFEGPENTQCDYHHFMKMSSQVDFLDGFGGSYVGHSQLEGGDL